MLSLAPAEQVWRFGFEWPQKFARKNGRQIAETRLIDRRLSSSTSTVLQLKLLSTS
jgi:hypothetical protein